MSFTQEEIEYYHSRGTMPDWAYYQQSQKPIAVKLQEQNKNLLQRSMAQEATRADRKAEKKFDKYIQEETEKALEKAVEDVLKKFKWN